MNSNFDVNGFMQMLEANKAKPRSNEDYKSLEKIYLSYPGNYGKYQILPMNSIITGYPFVPLTKTRELKMMRHTVLNDGTVNDFESWMRILPREAYVMKDPTDPTGTRVVSSLTNEDERLLNEATVLFDKLYDELGGLEKDKEKNKTIGFMRRRNYIIWFGRCINKWNLNNTREAEKKDFSGLFVCTAKDFLTSIDNNISDLKITHGGSDLWTQEIYNRQLTDRTGCLIFSISMDGGKIGYNISVQHCDGLANLKTYRIPEEDAELMKDPVETFLGWQASRTTPGRLFNPELTKELIDFMSAQLRAVQMAKQQGTDISAAIKNTTEAALKNQAAQAPAQTTNDPILRQQSPVAPQPNPADIYSKNTAPLSTPPAAQIDPISQNPIAPQQQPYQQQGHYDPINDGSYGKSNNNGATFAPPSNWGVPGTGNTGWMQPQTAPTPQQPGMNPFSNGLPF